MSTDNLDFHEEGLAYLDKPIINAESTAIHPAKPAKDKMENEKPDCSQHKKDLFGETDMKKVAEAIGDLHYETLKELMYHLSEKFWADSKNDKKGGRHRLSTVLGCASSSTKATAEYMEDLLEISKPFMQSSK